MDGTPITPPTDAPGATPRCWKCGYELTGMRVEQACPECGEAIWAPRRDASQADGLARKTLTWGIVSLVLFFVCIGPLAGLLTIPAFGYYRKFKAINAAGGASAGAAGSAKAGLVCAKIAAALSIIIVAVYGAMILAETSGLL